MIFLDWVGPLLLSLDEVSRVPMRIPGVYLLHVLDLAEGEYPVLYAGSSHSLRRRLLDHLRDRHDNPAIPAARRAGPTYFSAAPVLLPHLRTEIERSLIVRFRPPANRMFAETVAISTTVPSLAVPHFMELS